MFYYFIVNSVEESRIIELEVHSAVNKPITLHLMIVISLVICLFNFEIIYTPHVHA